MGKVTQHSEFDGVHFVLLPKIQPTNTKKRERQEDDTSAPPPPKRPQASSETISYIDCFEKAMKKMMLKDIQKATADKREISKSDMSAQKPRGLIKTAADIAGCTGNVFNNRINNELKSLTTDKAWKIFVNKNFDYLLGRANQQQDSSDNVSQNESAEEDIEEYETCTVSLNKIIREDLPSDMKKVILDQINRGMQKSTDYLSSFGMLLHLLILKFRTGVFAIENNSIIHKDQKGFQISSILPPNFEPSVSCQIRYSSSPVPQSVLHSSKKDYDLLFQKQHLNLLHSYYFGALGSFDQNLAGRPHQHALFQSAGEPRGAFKDHGLSSVEMEIARTNLITAMGNMWKTNTITTNLVNRVLGVLLKIHLLNKSKSYVYNHVTKASKKNQRLSLEIATEI